MITLFLVVLILYLGEHVALRFGLKQGTRPQADTEVARDLPRCTVVVCARNEEARIEACVRSLARLAYPELQLELLVMDDGSDDATAEILKQLTQEIPMLRVMRATERLDGLTGKSHALAQALDTVTSEFAFITDADCNVSPNWLADTLPSFAPTVGLVAGVTLLEGSSTWEVLQSVDHAYLEALELGAANIGVPLSAIGNNIALRMTAYHAIGGLRTLPHGLAEDYALFNGMWNSRVWKARYVLLPRAIVESTPCPTFAAWWRQRERWVKAGASPNIGTVIVFAFALASNLAMVLSPLVFTIPVAAGLIALKWLAELTLLYPMLRTLKRRAWLRFFVAYELYVCMFALSVPIMAASRSIDWKGREITFGAGAGDKPTSVRPSVIKQPTPHANRGSVL